MNFTPTLLEVELGYLLSADSPIADVADVDKAGRRIGVSQGSSSQAALPRLYKNAVTLVPANSLKEAQGMLRSSSRAVRAGVSFAFAGSYVPPFIRMHGSGVGFRGRPSSRGGSGPA